MRRATRETIIEKFVKVHGHLYSYEKVIYIDRRTKVCIIDPIYGEFWQTPDAHANGQGHPTRGK